MVYSDAELADWGKENRESGDDQDGWNLRKCAATTIDKMAELYPDTILPVVLPLLNANISKSGNNLEALNDCECARQREALILALGAIAEGCCRSPSHALEAQLPVLFPWMLAHLDTSVPPYVRSIACWALSRYASWAVREENKDSALKPLLEGNLNNLLDRRHTLVMSALGALSTVMEAAASNPRSRCLLVANSAPILEKVVQVFERGSQHYAGVLRYHQHIGGASRRRAPSAAPPVPAAGTSADRPMGQDV
jgi:transportin-1